MMKRYIASILTVFVFFVGMMLQGTAFAASSVESISKPLNSKNGTGSMTVTIQNVDLKVYEKYNSALQKSGKALKDTVLGKAQPGAKIVITINSTAKLEVFMSWVSFQAVKIAKGFPNIGEMTRFETKTGKATGSYTIPKNVEMIQVPTGIIYQSNPVGKYWGSVDRQYIIFTSDKAFKEAYTVLTGEKLTGPISSPATTKKETKRTEDNITTQTNMPSEDSDGFSWIFVGGGAIILIGGGLMIWEFIGKGRDGGTGAGSGADAAETVPSEPESFVYTDPATGAQMLFQKDPETGEWYDPSTNSIMNPDDLERFNRQRMEDRKWMDGQTDNLRNRNTDMDRQLKSDYEDLMKKYDEIDRQGAKDQAAIRSGTYGMTDEERTQYLNQRQGRYVSSQEKAYQVAKNWDRAVKTAEVTQKAADLAVDGLSVATGPAGKLVANIYTGVKNVAGETTNAVVNGKSIVGGIAKGLAQGGADIAQNLAGDSEMKWFKKVLTYAGTETGKELITATVDGESKAAAVKKGLANGLFKYSVDFFGDNISGGFAQQNSNAMKQHYKEISWNWNKSLSQKSVNALNKMNFQKFAGKEQARELTQGFVQSFTKDGFSTAYDMASEGKSATEAMFGEKW